MDGPRAPFDNELPHLIKFLDVNLRSEQNWSIADEYPLAFAKDNLNNIRIVRDDDQVLAHAVMRPMIMKTPAGLFKFAAIGSVVTSSEHRNLGLSSKTIDSCLAAASAHGCDFAVLWTSLYDFYRKLGFELAGSEVSISINKEIQCQIPNGFKVIEGNKVSHEAIHRIYLNHTVHSLRTPEETRRYLQIPNSRVYTAWDHQQQLIAYAIEGKGADLNGYIHEWGGNITAILPLINHIFKTQNRPLTLITPQHSQNLVKHLTDQNFKTHSGFLGMIKLLNPNNVFGKIKRLSRQQGVSDLVLEYRDQKFYVGTGEKILTTDSANDIVRLVFGPQDPSEIGDFPPEVLKTLQSVLPIPIWVWGWDSV